MPGTVRKPAAKKAAATTSFTFEADLNRETKGTFRMDEIGDNPFTGSIYLKKAALESVKPQKVRVTVEILEEQE